MKIIRSLTALVLTLFVTVAGLAGAAAPASADDTAGGWVRLAHLSPDTPAVNVSLSSLSSDKTMLTLDDVGYGDVSASKRVPAGTYVASMTEPGGSAPKITQSVTVKPNYAYTVAAVGTQAELSGKVISDDLTPPKSGTAKVRLIQASTVAPTVTVTAVDGPVLARDASFGTATGYAAIDPGVWTVKVAPQGGAAAPATAKITARPGTINTVVVLDGRDGAVTTKQISDASGAAMAPKKSTGVETGGGGTAGVTPLSLGGETVVGFVAVAGVVVAGLVVLARRLFRVDR